MTRRVPPIARIRLARSIPRLLGLPLVMVGVGAAISALAALGVLPLATVALGGPLVLWGILIAIRPVTARLDVEESAVRLHWVGGERVYALAPGPVTRVRLRGEESSQLRSKSGGTGWILGAARLRDEEDVEAIRLAATDTAILVPTERGRLAIAAASEDELLDALSRAARARQRLEELAHAAPPPPPPAPVPATEIDIPASAALEPHVLTGIERALMEERLAREQEQPAALGTDVPSADNETPRNLGPVTVASAAPSRWRPRTAAGSMARLGRPRPSAAFVLLPLLAAGTVWGAATALGRLPEPGSDLARLAALGLVLGGPATSIGAIMARAWWPRIVGIVVIGGLAASVFVGRALFGA